jgi:HSP20 family protein
MAIKDLIPSWRKGVPARREEDDPFSLFRKEMDSLMENFFRGAEGWPIESRLGAFSPKVDVAESEKEIKVSAELPGMDEKDIELSLTKDSLTIRGEKKQEKEEKTKDYYRMERSYGSFVRTVQLPVEIDEDKVEASFKKGLLTVTLPKTEKAVKETKKIPISSA